MDSEISDISTVGTAVEYSDRIRPGFPSSKTIYLVNDALTISSEECWGFPLATINWLS